MPAMTALSAKTAHLPMPGTPICPPARAFPAKTAGFGLEMPPPFRSGAEFRASGAAMSDAGAEFPLRATPPFGAGAEFRRAGVPMSGTGGPLPHPGAAPISRSAAPGASIAAPTCASDATIPSSAAPARHANQPQTAKP